LTSNCTSDQGFTLMKQHACQRARNQEKTINVNLEKYRQRYDSPNCTKRLKYLQFIKSDRKSNRSKTSDVWSNSENQNSDLMKTPIAPQPAHLHLDGCNVAFYLAVISATPDSRMLS